MSDVAAIILAAGRGTRFRPARSKLVASWRGAPLLRHVAETAKASGAAPIILVTGHDSAPVARTVDGLGLTIVENEAYAEGISTSLRAGLATLGESVSGTLVLLGDMPLVAVDTLQRLIAAHHAAPADCIAIVPRYIGRRGNPVLLRRPIFREAMQLTGDAGAGRLFVRPAPVVFLDVDDPGVITDIDSAKDLDSLSRM